MEKDVAIRRILFGEFDDKNITDAQKIKALQDVFRDAGITNASSISGPRKLIVWSGGMDSTSLVLEAVRNKQNFSTVYIKLECNKEKSEYELLARDRIKEIIRTEFNVSFLDTVIVVPHEVCKYFNGASFRQASMWFLAMFSGMVSLESYEEIEFGYVHHDGIWCDIDRYLNFFKAGCVMLNSSEDKKFPVIKFPFKHFTKEDIAKELTIVHDAENLPTIRKVMSAIWACEPVFPGQKDQCGKCRSCLGQQMILQKIDLRLKELFEQKCQPSLGIDEYSFPTLVDVCNVDCSENIVSC